MESKNKHRIFSMIRNLLSTLLITYLIIGLNSCKITSEISPKDIYKIGRDKKDDTKLLSLYIAQNKNGTIKIPKGDFYISNSIILPSNIKLEGEGINKTRILITNNKVPAFDCFYENNISISELSIVNINTPILTDKKSLRGGHSYLLSCGIYTNGNSNQFFNLNIDGFVTGIILSPFTYNKYEKKIDNHLRNIVVKDVEFGILAAGQHDFTIKNISGNYLNHKNSDYPPHLIYFSEGKNGVVSKNGFIENCYAYDSDYGHAYQFKELYQSTIKNISSKNCNGILSLDKSGQLNIIDIEALNDFPPTSGSLFIQGNDSEYLHIKNFTIENKNSNARILRFGGENNIYENISITDEVTMFGDLIKIYFEGNYSTLKDLDYQNLNVDQGVVAIHVSGKGNILKNVTLKNVRSGIDISEDCENCLIDLDSVLIILNKNVHSRNIRNQSRSTILKRTNHD